MTKNTNPEGEEAARLDRERTGEAVNARDDALQKELNQETDQLKRKYEEPAKPEAGTKKN